VAVPIAAWCALRYGELAELRRQDVDAVNHVIKVRRGVIFPRDGPVVGPPKSDAGVRDIVIPPHVWPIIEQHLDMWVTLSPNALLFPGAGGRQMWH
jgi:integrase